MTERIRWTRRSTPYNLAAALNSLNEVLGTKARALVIHEQGLPHHVFVKIPQSTPQCDAHWFAFATSRHGYGVTWHGVRDACNLFKLEEVVQPEVFA